MHRLKLFTNESMVHSQVSTLEHLLGRRIECEIIMNVKNASSSIQFDANDGEIQTIRSGSNFNLLKRQGGYWIPVM
jgi:hypothetical protein